MAKPLGSPKTGGRKKGTPNRKTQELEEVLRKNKLDVVGELKALMPKVSPEKQADILLSLMNYIYPKRKAVEIQQEDQAHPHCIEIEIVSTQKNVNSLD
jgi:hypothetical protein